MVEQLTNMALKKEVFGVLREKACTINKAAFDELCLFSDKNGADPVDVLRRVLAQFQTEAKTVAIIDKNAISGALNSVRASLSQPTGEKSRKAAVLATFSSKSRVHCSDIFAERYRFLKSGVKKFGAANSKNETVKPVLTTVENLTGSVGPKTVFGMVAEIEENKCFLEDVSGYVEIRFSENSVGKNVFLTWGSFVALNGSFDDDVFNVNEVLTTLPPSLETENEREKTANQPRFLKDEKRLCEEAVVIASEVHLDRENTLLWLKALFSGFSETPPKMFVLMGDFCSSANIGLEMYKAGFSKLSELIQSFKAIFSSSEFLFVPGPNDMTVSSNFILPRSPLNAFALENLLSFGRTILGSSPSVFRAECGRSAVFFRENLFAKLNRNSFIVPSDMNGETELEKVYKDLIWAQRFLVPVPAVSQPLSKVESSWKSMFLAEIPDAVFLGDMYGAFWLREGGGGECGSLVGTSVFSETSEFVVWYSDLKDKTEWVEFSKILG